jgi:hypothetical protein
MAGSAVVFGTGTITGAGSTTAAFDVKVTSAPVMADNFFFVITQGQTPVAVQSLSGVTGLLNGAAVGAPADWQTIVPGANAAQAVFAQPCLFDEIQGTITTAVSLQSGVQYTLTVYAASAMENVVQTPSQSSPYDYSGTIQTANTAQTIFDPSTLSTPMQGVYFLFQNQSSAPMFLAFGDGTLFGAGQPGLQIPPGGVYEISTPTWNPLAEAVQVKCAQAGAQYVCFIGLKPVI